MRPLATLNMPRAGNLEGGASANRDVSSSRLGMETKSETAAFPLPVLKPGDSNRWRR